MKANAGGGEVLGGFLVLSDSTVPEITACSATNRRFLRLNVNFLKKIEFFLNEKTQISRYVLEASQHVTYDWLRFDANEDAKITAAQLQKLLNVFTFKLNKQTYLAHAALKDIFKPLAESGCFQAKK